MTSSKLASEYVSDAEKKLVFLVLEKTLDEKRKEVNFIGSGFIIENKYVITNYHVWVIAEQNAPISLHVGIYNDHNNDTGITNYKSQKITLVDTDKENDIVILKLETEVSKDFSFSLLDLVDSSFSEYYKHGDDAIYCGFPLATDFIKMGIGLTLFVNKCCVSAIKYNQQKKNIDYILIDSHVNPSSSGSVLLSTTSGKILGIVAGTFHQNFITSTAAEKVSKNIQIPRNIGLVRPSVHIYNLLKNISPTNNK